MELTKEKNNNQQQKKNRMDVKYGRLSRFSTSSLPSVASDDEVKREGRDGFMMRVDSEIGSAGSSSSYLQRKLMVLVDMDGVLCDFDAAVNRYYGEMYPDEPLIDLEHERSYFYMKQNYQVRYGKEAAAKVKRITEMEGFFESLPPIPGGIAALQEMAKDPRIDVMICTSPLSYYHFVLREKFQWVEKHLGEEWLQRIIITKDKTVVSGDILIDDRPSITGLRETPDWEHVLFDQPYNRSVENKRRLTSWEDTQWKNIIDELILS